MGQHQTNQTAKMAKEGQLPPKPRPLSKYEQDKILEQKIHQAIFDTMYKTHK